MTGPPVLILTCEHASRRVPPRWRARFAGRERVLASHRAWDPGALAVARALARALDAPLVAGDVTRLLVDLNRSPRNPAVVGAWGRELPVAEQERLLERHHRPHWDCVRARLDEALATGRPVLHVGVHSFVPVLGGRRRRFDVGLLYDPARPGERRFAASWKRALEAAGSGLVVRRNAPYRGTSDGLTTALRRVHGPRRYLGVELELGQAWLGDPRARRFRLAAIRSSLASLVGGSPGGR
jgi:predicted N-formylglutamate amidohydrolase